MKISLSTLGLLSLVLVLPSIARGADYAGKCLAFDGADAFVSVAAGSDFQFPNGFTVECWVKPTFSFDDGYYRTFVRGAFADPPAGGGAWMLGGDDVEQSVPFFGASTPATDSAIGSSGEIVPNEWQHLAGTFDGTHLNLYRNGDLIASKVHPHPGDVSNASRIIFGRWERSFRGYLDEVRIWNVVRSREQIKSNKNCSLVGDETGLVGYWRFDEGSGQTTRDSAGDNSEGRLGSSAGVDAQDPIWADSDAPITCLIPRNDPFRRGDVNQDREVDMADAIGILNYLFAGAAQPSCLDAADANDDGTIDLSDAMTELGFLFLGKLDTLPAPFPGCGFDATRDRLGCDEYRGCIAIIPVDLLPPVALR